MAQHPGCSIAESCPMSPLPNSRITGTLAPEGGDLAQGEWQLVPLSHSAQVTTTEPSLSLPGHSQDQVVHPQPLAITPLFHIRGQKPGPQASPLLTTLPRAVGTTNTLRCSCKVLGTQEVRLGLTRWASERGLRQQGWRTNVGQRHLVQPHILAPDLWPHALLWAAAAAIPGTPASPVLARLPTWARTREGIIASRSQITACAQGHKGQPQAGALLFNCSTVACPGSHLLCPPTAFGRCPC